uniref:Uncharacterized protein n=1 Tax=Triticum urartu TaxID=4572 RepID=A0A8R7RDL8_TRIUA
MLRYKFVSHKFHDFASEAASDPECILLMDNALDILAKQVREKLRISRSILSESSNVQPNVQQDEGLLSSARLKKKEVQPKSSKRHKPWIKKTRKYKKKDPKESSQQEKENQVGGETQATTENANNASNAFRSYTDLLMGSNGIDDMDFGDL